MVLHSAGQELEPGQKKKAVILNVDMLKLEVHVSLCHDLVNRKAKKVSLLIVDFIPMISAALHTSATPHALQMLVHRVAMCLDLFGSFPGVPVVLVCFCFCFCFCFFDQAVWLAGSWFPDQELNLGPGSDITRSQPWDSRELPWCAR